MENLDLMNRNGLVNMDKVKEDISVCKQCLLRDFNEQEYFDKLHKYIVTLDKEVKASDELYKKRLAVCKECSKLLEGTCLSCGCFVELRAAIKKNKCPNKNW
ncbi:MAG TPA: DUF6171 family protein [Lachnospiraceae bacterium]|nr:DUF6171 family protein [Lachnospiraceae bacterium]